MDESEQLQPSKVIYENPTIDRNPAIQAQLDSIGFVRTPFIICTDPYCQGFANANTELEADDLWHAYTNAGHKQVMIYVRADLYNKVSRVINFNKPIETNDAVNHPSHYNFSKFEVIDVLMEWFPANPLLWQAGKYIARAAHKGTYLQDLEKAKFYLEREIEATKATLKEVKKF